jgi:UDP-3-O-[3-hydroxymyristoyl] N-acetylglucosamine deacetylase
VIYRRSTVTADVTFEGLGLHSGISVKVVVHPAQDGLHFRSPSGRWQAIPENVTDTTRSTRLGEIGTIEHLMSALAGLQITDAEVEVSAGELPAMDGSAAPYANALLNTGLTSLGEAELTRPFARTFVQREDSKVAISAGTGKWRYEFTTGDRWPREQILETEDVIADYVRGIAPARTFGFVEELPMIEKYGLAKGLDKDSALILGHEGYLNEPRCADEPVRHKMLDAIGDIYLAGVPIHMLNVVAVRTGHTATVEAARLLRDRG